jgi:hypothetical protein
VKFHFIGFILTQQGSFQTIADQNLVIARQKRALRRITAPPLDLDPDKSRSENQSRNRACREPQIQRLGVNLTPNRLFFPLIGDHHYATAIWILQGNMIDAG